MPRLTIQHVPDSSPPRFRLRRERDGKTTDLVEIPSPYQRQVGEGNRSLMDELRWYLENFLDYPFAPETDRAERTLDALEAWGEEAFDALFGGSDGQLWLHDGRRDGDVQIAVSADDPHVLSWPWEGLYDPRRGWIVQQHAVTRRLNDVDDPPPLPDLPDDRVNVLLVTARPLDEDAPYRSIARPLVETVKEQDLPASITVLRPPTFDNLREHLRDHPDHYHVVHFDGHGGYLEEAGTVPGDRHQLRGPQGHLVFETPGDFDPDPIPADRLSQLLREHNIPAAVLNACQSGMVDDAADDAFASVAASLLRAGVRSVVAMSHAVMVSGAQEFVPPFYERLFETGSLAEAARAGRREMLAHPERICARGEFPLQDWLVPVVYEQAEVPFDFVADAEPPTDEAPDLPEPPEDVQGQYGFVGRDRELLKLERAMERDPAGVLVYGLGGIGKTTLVWGFLRWLADTDGLAHEPFWFTFSEIQSAEFVLNRIGERFYGEEFAALDTGEKLDRLVAVLDEVPGVLVWDNFESAAAMDEEAGEALLSEEDRETLRTLLRRLRGTGTKVLITSRNDEDWLGGPAHVQRHTLGGLQGEERWRFCEEIVDDLPGVTLDREDDALKKLMDTLRGHPLAMRVVLPRLADRSPDALRETVENNLDALDSAGDEALDRLYATLELATEVLGDDLQELLVPLRLHERFVDANIVEVIAEQAGSRLTREQIDLGLHKLTDVGLLHNVGGNVYAVHPALTGYLQAKDYGSPQANCAEGWTEAFVQVMATHANHFAGKSFHEQRSFIVYREPNIIQALGHADLHGWKEEKGCLVNFLGSSAQNRCLYDVAEKRYEQWLEVHEQLDNEAGIARAYHQLGVVARKRRNLDKAERRYQKSVQIEKGQEETHLLASTYHDLGIVAQERWNLEEAEEWYRKSTDISDRLGRERLLAKTYHQLGMVARRRRDFGEAEEWYHKSAEIKERLGEEYLLAMTYHDLGIVAQERRDLEEAEEWYRKSTDISDRLGQERLLSISYHQLGMVARKRRDFGEAEEWCRKSAEIKERLGEEYLLAQTYRELGVVAQGRKDLESAARWCRKSMDLAVRLEEEHLLAKTYGQLGSIARERGDLEESGKWYRKSLEIKKRIGDDHGLATTYQNLGIVAQMRQKLDEAEKWFQKSAEIKERLGKRHLLAKTHGQRGKVCRQRGNLQQAGQWFLKAIRGFLLTNDPSNAQLAVAHFGRTINDAPPDVRDSLRQLWTDAGHPEERLDDLLDQLDEELP